MVLAKPFTTASPYIASYNWQDFITDNGYVNFYCYDTIEDQNILVSEQLYSYSDHKQRAGSAGSWDFDTSPFLNKIIINGIMYLTVGVGNESGNDIDLLTISVIKYDGSTETVLGTWSSVANWAPGNDVVVLKFSVTDAQINVGDILRVSVDVALSAGNGMSFGINSEDRWTTTTDYTTGKPDVVEFKLQVPVKTDI